MKPILFKSIKPCPFCGGKAKIAMREYRYLGYTDGGHKVKRFRVRVMCNKCKATGPGFTTDPIIRSIGWWDNLQQYKDMAIDGWNRR